VIPIYLSPPLSPQKLCFGKFQKCCHLFDYVCAVVRSEIRKIPNSFYNTVRIVILSFLQLSAIYVIMVWGDPAYL
jgi:hypothetical protein